MGKSDRIDFLRVLMWNILILKPWFALAFETRKSHLGFDLNVYMVTHFKHFINAMQLHIQHRYHNPGQYTNQ